MKIDKDLIGVNIEGFEVIEDIGSGAVGQMFLCESKETGEQRALKFIPENGLRENWQREFMKVIKLKSTPGIVRYYSNGEFETKKHIKYKYIMWEYIESDSLKKLIDQNMLTVPIVCDVVERILSVLYACQIVDIQHADLHTGNILIQRENMLNIDSEKREVWVTDFGYGSFANEVAPLDDYLGFARIIQECVNSIDFHSLEKEERNIYRVLKNEFPKYLEETNATEGEYVKTPKKLRELFHQLCSFSNGEQKRSKSVADYLAAELIGDRYSEWDNLFVPKFIALDELLDVNICVLTGLRGCGKTMMFKRISYPLAHRMPNTGIEKQQNFLGFYLNARNIAEAFPWLPEQKEEDARRQIINYFHVKWSIEILQWIREELAGLEVGDLQWLISFWGRYLPNMITTAMSGKGVVDHILSYLNQEIYNGKLGSGYDKDKQWQFTDYNFLDLFIGLVKKNMPNYGQKDIFLFLDDYSVPMVNEPMQRILNPIIFRRSELYNFKISTESVESFVKTGLNRKVLQESADYKLIDVGAEIFLKKENEIKEILTAIFEKRITRDERFFEKGLNLIDILGTSDLSENERARKIQESKKPVKYYGIDVFCNLWSSDIRELIRIFADIIGKEQENIIQKKLQEKTNGLLKTGIISGDIQDAVIREAGGRFYSLLAGATPTRRNVFEKFGNDNYGAHLVDIAMAFQEIAYCDLKIKTSKNQGNKPPKQARKIEVTDTRVYMSEIAEEYLRGLIRYGVFIKDSRGKGVRGNITTRLYFRSMLIPYSRLTFSKRDSIMLSWKEVENLILNPKEFIKQYKKKIENRFDGQISIEDYQEGNKSE